MGTDMLAHLRKGFITVKEFLVSAMGLNTRGIIVTDCVKEKVFSSLPLEICTKACLSQECQKAKAFISFRAECHTRVSSARACVMVRES